MAQQSPLDHGEDLVGDARSEVAPVEPAHLLESVDRRGFALCDADEGQIGQDEAGRLVGLGRSLLAPGRQLLRDAKGRASKMAALLDARPRVGRVGRDPNLLAQQLAFVHRPGEAVQRLELGLESISDLEQVGDIGDGVVELGL